MKPRLKSRSLAIAALSIAAGAMLAPVPLLADEEDKVLRVCEDPNNLPFSNREQMGFENKIADLLAQELGWRVEYTWYPQRMGFVRNTLRSKVSNTGKFQCDLIMGVPKGFELAATTKPYYRSTYAMAYVKGKGLDQVNSLEDLLALDPDKRKALRIGVFVRSPATDWLLQNGMIDQIVSYQAQTGDAAQYPGQIIEQDLAQGKLDIAFVWGPIASYFARNSRTVPVAAIPLKPRDDIHFVFEISMGVRHADKAFREQLDGLLEKNRDKITAILVGYNVPLVNEHGEVIASGAPK